MSKHLVMVAMAAVSKICTVKDGIDEAIRRVVHNTQEMIRRDVSFQIHWQIKFANGLVWHLHFTKGWFILLRKLKNGRPKSFVDLWDSLIFIVYRLNLSFFNYSESTFNLQLWL